MPWEVMVCIKQWNCNAKTCTSSVIHTHDTTRRQGYMTPMLIPMEPMDSIALDVFD